MLKIANFENYINAPIMPKHNGTAPLACWRENCRERSSSVNEFILETWIPNVYVGIGFSVGLFASLLADEIVVAAVIRVWKITKVNPIHSAYLTNNIITPTVLH